MRSPTRRRSSTSAICPSSRPSAVSWDSGATAAARGELLRRYYQELTARGFSADAAQLVAVARLEDLRTRLIEAAVGAPRWLAALLPSRARAPVKGLYIWGGVGRGKTWLMDLFFTSLPFPQRRRRHFHRFMHDVHAQLKQLGHQRAPLDHIAAGIARATRVLCFDELYVTDIADAMILGALFDGLLRRGVTLVVTSNLPPDELYRDGLQRQRFLPAIRLLEEHLEILQLAGPTDYRLRQLTQAGTYLLAGAPDTARRLAALFSELGGAGVQQGGSILIEGRPIPVIRLAHDAAWFDFRALCGGPRSQEDYIEIARAFQSVFVSDVPLFDADHEDEARRFVALVDELYDRNVNLIISAAAAPTQLYRAERVRAMFERTTSRLTEMQSAEYLAREHRP
jgi:cell division protein ZapE